MAVYTTIDDAGSFYSTKLYTGTGSSLALTGVGFQPDFTWIKNRDTSDFFPLTDAVRGATKYIQSNTTVGETTNAESLKSFDSDGFTVGTMNEVNTSTEDYASWNWKAGTTTGIATDGNTTITPTAYSFNQTSGFSILQYTGNGVAGAKVAHGLGVTPGFIFVKCSSATQDWCGYSQGLDATAPEDYNIQINGTVARNNDINIWNDTAPDSINFTIGGSADLNTNTATMVAYCFAPIRGYSKFGFYEGNGNADGPFAYTGFRPGWLLIKNADAVSDWQLFDNKRLGYNTDNWELLPNSLNNEDENQYIDLCANGFKLRHTYLTVNTNAETYIYMAFAEAPLVNSSGVPGNAR